MYNPFRKLTSSDLNTLIEQEYYYGAVQHFKRAFQQYTLQDKTGLLITFYKYQGDAERHLENVVDKRHAALVHLHHRTHLLKVQQMLSDTSPYIIFNGNRSNQEDILKKDMELFKPQLLGYLNRDVDINRVTTFKIAPVLQIIYGELFIVIGEGFDKQKIKLDSIEEM